MSAELEDNNQQFLQTFASDLDLELETWDLLDDKDLTFKVSSLQLSQWWP